MPLFYSKICFNRPECRKVSAKPQSPRDVRLISFSSTWLLVGWRAGFNGGAEQQFQFEYRKVNPWKGSPDGTEPTTITIGTRNASTQTLYWVGKNRVALLIEYESGLSKFLSKISEQSVTKVLDLLDVHLWH